MSIDHIDGWARRLAEQALGDGAPIPGIHTPVTPDDSRLYIRCAASRGDTSEEAFWPRTPGARVTTDPGLVDAGNDSPARRQEMVYHKIRATAATVVAYIPMAQAIGPVAYLSGADLHGADLHGADLHGADLTRANLHGAAPSSLTG